MNRRMTAVFMTVALLAGFASSAWAELSAGERLAVESLIKQFSVRPFAARQKAVQKLISIGPKVLPVVQKTFAETEDKEVKLRCQMVLDGIAKKHGIKTTVATVKATRPPPGRMDLKASKVTIKMKDATLQEILQELAEQSGNKVIRMPEDWEEKDLTLEVTNMLYWQAVDELCKKAKLLYTTDRRSGGLVLTDANDSTDVSAYAGPFVVKLVSGNRQKYFRRLNTRGRPEGLSYVFNYYCEDRLAPLSKTVTLTKAVAPDGQVLKIPAPPAGAAGAAGAMGPGMFRGMRGNTVRVTISGGAKGLEKLALLEGIVTMDLGQGKKELKIKDALGEGERSVQDGDKVIKITRVRRMRGFTTISLTQTEDGKDVAMTRYPAASGYGFSLIDPDGGVHKTATIAGMMRGGNRNRRRGGNRRAPAGRNQGADRGQRNVVATAENDDGLGGTIFIANLPDVAAKEDAEVQLAQADPGANAGRRGRRGGPRGGRRGGPRGFMRRLGGLAMFRDLPDMEGEWTLVYTVPGKTSKKEFPFSFKDVPTP